MRTVREIHIPLPARRRSRYSSPLMQFDDLSFPSEVVVADVVEAKVQAMNLGRSKIYNVRAEIAADGLKPQGTIFIGDMEAGTAATGSTQVSVSSLSWKQAVWKYRRHGHLLLRGRKRQRIYGRSDIYHNDQIPIFGPEGRDNTGQYEPVVGNHGDCDWLYRSCRRCDHCTEDTP